MPPTPRRRRTRGLAGADRRRRRRGAPAGVLAAHTTLPVIGVPIRDGRSPGSTRCSDRPDAARHPGGDRRRRPRRQRGLLAVEMLALGRPRARGQTGRAPAEISPQRPRPPTASYSRALQARAPTRSDAADGGGRTDALGGADAGGTLARKRGSESARRPGAGPSPARIRRSMREKDRELRRRRHRRRKRLERRLRDDAGRDSRRRRARPRASAADSPGGRDRRGARRRVAPGAEATARKAGTKRAPAQAGDRRAPAAPTPPAATALRPRAAARAHPPLAAAGRASVTAAAGASPTRAPDQRRRRRRRPPSEDEEPRQRRQSGESAAPLDAIDLRPRHGGRASVRYRVAIRRRRRGARRRAGSAVRQRRTKGRPPAAARRSGERSSRRASPTR